MGNERTQCTHTMGFDKAINVCFYYFPTAFLLHESHFRLHDGFRFRESIIIFFHILGTINEKKTHQPSEKGEKEKRKVWFRHEFWILLWI